MDKLKIIMLVVAFLALSGCDATQFDGNMTGNDHQFITDFKVLNKTFDRKLELSAGDTLSVKIEKEAGTISLEIVSKDGSELYRGDDIESADFQLPIKEDGTYSFKLTGKKAKGNVSIIRE